MEETERVEEYLETLCRFEELHQKPTTTRLARALMLAPPSVTEMLQKLKKRGYINYVQYRNIELTVQGRELGYKILRKHRLIESFLRLLDVPETYIHDEACKLEHKLSDLVEHLLKQHLEEIRKNLNVETLEQSSIKNSKKQK